MEEAEYLEFDLLDLEGFINPPDINNFPPDVPTHNPIDLRKLDLKKVLYPMSPIASA